MSLQKIFSSPHKFKLFEKEYGPDDSKICVVCGHGPDLHECELCPDNEKRCPEIMFMTMRLCKVCYQKELAAQEELAKGAEERVEQSKADFVRRAAEESRKLLDQSITVRSDYFNANIPAIVDTRNGIFSQTDKSDQDKHFEYVQYLLDMQVKLKRILIDMRDAEQKINARMQIQHVEINESVNKLRDDQRKALQLENIDYKPIAPKVSKTPKAPATPATKTRVNMKEVDEVAKKYNVPSATVRQVMLYRKLSADAAAREVVQQFAIIAHTKKEN